MREINVDVTFLLDYNQGEGDIAGKSMWSLSWVRELTKLAVYDEIMMRVKNHQRAAIIRVEKALKVLTLQGQ